MHVSLFILGLVVKKPDVAAAGQMNDACLEEAQAYDSLITILLVVHALCFLATLFREIFSADVGFLGQMMSILEVMMIPAYLYSLLIATQWMAVILIRQLTKDQITANAPPGDAISCKGESFLCDKCQRDNYEMFVGGTFEFIFIEIMVYATYVTSMFLYIVRSRCMRVG